VTDGSRRKAGGRYMNSWHVVINSDNAFRVSARGGGGDMLLFFAGFAAWLREGCGGTARAEAASALDLGVYAASAAASSCMRRRGVLWADCSAPLRHRRVRVSWLTDIDVPCCGRAAVAVTRPTA
jgi:hypothetical protein